MFPLVMEIYSFSKSFASAVSEVKKVINWIFFAKVMGNLHAGTGVGVVFFFGT